jgi:hypothetical protein
VKPSLGATLLFRLAVALAFTGLEGACTHEAVSTRFQLVPENIIAERRPDAAYERFFPYYVELCAASQFRSKLTGQGGGAAGHAVLYLKGACKDDDAAFPQLRRCRRVATSLADPEHGAGISINQWFRNVNWVATPGYDLVFDGDLASGERVTRGAFAAVERQAIAEGIYKGVAFHPLPGATAPPDLHEFLERSGIGTDLALRFARSLFCARLPVTPDMMDQIIAFLNAKNREYFKGEADYNWSAWADNCSHTLRNALAAANIWPPVSVRTIKIRQIFNLAVPANEFVNLAELITGSIPDYREIMRDEPQRDAFHEFHWLPTEPGALLSTLPVHSPNDIYDTRFRLFTLQSPLLMGKTRRAIALLSDERFVDLETNLLYFQQRYAAILARHDERRDDLASVRGTRFRRVEQLWYQYIHTRRSDVEAMLRRLSAPDARPPPPAAFQTSMTGTE